MRLQLVFSQWAKSYMSANYFCLIALIGHKVKTENIWLCLCGYSIILQNTCASQVISHRGLLGLVVGHVCPIGDTVLLSKGSGTNVPWNWDALINMTALYAYSVFLPRRIRILIAALLSSLLILSLGLDIRCLGLDIRCLDVESLYLLVFLLRKNGLRRFFFESYWLYQETFYFLLFKKYVLFFPALVLIELGVCRCKVLPLPFPISLQGVICEKVLLSHSESIYVLPCWMPAVSRERTPVLVEWNDAIGWLGLCNLIMPSIHLKHIFPTHSGGRAI